MGVVVRKVDSKCRVTLPPAFAGKSVVIDHVSDVEVRVRVRPAVRARPTLESLLQGVTDENRHHEYLA